MTKWVRRGFGSREITTFYAESLSILAEYDKRGVNPLGSTIQLVRRIESPFVRRCAESAQLLLRQLHASVLRATDWRTVAGFLQM